MVKAQPLHSHVVFLNDVSGGNLLKVVNIERVNPVLVVDRNEDHRPVLLEHHLAVDLDGGGA